MSQPLDSKKKAEQEILASLDPPRSLETPVKSKSRLPAQAIAQIKQQVQENS